MKKIILKHFDSTIVEAIVTAATATVEATTTQLAIAVTAAVSHKSL